jgi:hypothetical protein
MVCPSIILPSFTILSGNLGTFSKILSGQKGHLKRLANGVVNNLSWDDFTTDSKELSDSPCFGLVALAGLILVCYKYHAKKREEKTCLVRGSVLNSTFPLIIFWNAKGVAIVENRCST